MQPFLTSCETLSTQYTVRMSQWRCFWPKLMTYRNRVWTLLYSDTSSIRSSKRWVKRSASVYKASGWSISLLKTFWTYAWCVPANSGAMTVLLRSLSHFKKSWESSLSKLLTRISTSLLITWTWTQRLGSIATSAAWCRSCWTWSQTQSSSSRQTMGRSRSK